MLVATAQLWAALRISFCHLLRRAGLASKLAVRSLATPPRLVPSGMKLIVTTSGLGQALAVAE
ncbi:MAG: hypothetical protein WKF75_11025 [Singulisphaera sp.]